jgi:predicted nucleic acid-binding Zn ribbon protein
MTEKKPQLERLGEVLDKSLKRLDLGPRLNDYGVWPIWNDIVGPTIARNAQPEKIRGGTLFVKVSSPVWMQQLQFMKEMIAERLNHRLEREVVKNIFFMVGRIDVPAEVAEQKCSPTPAPTAPESGVGEDFLNSINDPEIRDAFKKLLKSFARRKAKT